MFEAEDVADLVEEDDADLEVGLEERVARLVELSLRVRRALEFPELRAVEGDARRCRVRQRAAGAVEDELVVRRLVLPLERQFRVRGVSGARERDARRRGPLRLRPGTPFNVAST